MSAVPPGTLRHHLITDDQLEDVLAAGGRIVATLPGDGYIVVVPSGAVELPEIDPESKISAELDADETAKQPVVIEFFPDIPREEFELALLRAGVVLRLQPDLTTTQVMAEASAREVRWLARRDDVAYIFPAAAELQRGEPVFGCLNSVSGTPGAGQYILTVGHGWDGPGRGEASLTYSWQRLTDKLPTPTVKELITRALEEWSKHVRIRFTYTDAVSEHRNLNILFGSKAHGDEYPFDGLGRVLAHTFFPYLPNPEPIAGDLHLDADESWENRAQIDLYSVVLHEIGHALGLGHADRPNAVMYPYYRRVSALAADDIAAIRRLYAAAGPESATVPPLKLVTETTRTVATAMVDLSGTTTGGSGEVRVTWSDARGNSGVAEGSRSWRIAGIALITGVNTFRITASDEAGGETTVTVRVTRTAAAAPQIRVTSGNPATGEYSGTASHASGIRKVQWSNSAGGSAVAEGTTNWSARVPLRNGSNTVRFTATAEDGSQAYVSVTTSVGGPDRTAPSVTIVSPVGSSVATRQPAIRISGMASDNAEVAEVRWSTSAGQSGTASGRTSWSIDAVPLAVGYNVVTVRACDAAGNSGWKTVAVTRQP